MIEVDYEELPAVLNVDDALKPGATLVHDSVKLPASGFADLAELKPIDGTNICTHFKLNRGDIDKGFAEADQVFEDTFTLPATQHSFLETHACIASVEPGGRITVWATTQNPFVVRTQLANIFKVPVSKVRVIVPYLGGGYGGKVYPKVEPITVALAQKAGRPVRVVLSREEVFYTITKHAAVIRMKTGVKNDGTLMARECEIHLDTGAYAEIGPRVAKKSGYTAAGPYRIANLKIDSYSVYTNKPPAGAFRGFGVSQSAWAVESQMDIIAAALKMDPLELRMKNGYNDGDKFVTEETLRAVGLERVSRRSGEVDRMGKEKTDSRRFKQRFKSSMSRRVQPELRRGKGLACMIKATITPSISCAVVKLNEDASLSIYTGTVEMGQGSETVLAQIAGKELGIPMPTIQVLGVDTDVVPYDLTTSSSRSTFHMGKAVQLAAQDIMRQLKQIVVKEYGVPEDKIDFADGKIRLPEAQLDYAEVMFKRFGMQGGTLGRRRAGEDFDQRRIRRKEHFGVLVSRRRRRRSRSRHRHRQIQAAQIRQRRRCRQGAQSARLPPAVGRRGDHRHRPGDVRGDRLRQRPADQSQSSRLRPAFARRHAGGDRFDRRRNAGPQRSVRRQRHRRERADSGRAGDRQRDLRRRRCAHQRSADQSGKDFSWRWQSQIEAVSSSNHAQSGEIMRIHVKTNSHTCVASLS